MSNLARISPKEDREKYKQFRRPIVEILNDLSQPIPPRLLKQKPIFKKEQGKSVKVGEINFVPWKTLIKLLDYYAPGFQWRIRVKDFGEKTVIEGSLTIYAEEGEFTRESVAQENANVSGYGDAVTNAEASVLRRCCQKFGLGLNVK